MSKRKKVVKDKVLDEYLEGIRAKIEQQAAEVAQQQAEGEHAKPEVVMGEGAAEAVAAGRMHVLHAAVAEGFQDFLTAKIKEKYPQGADGKYDIGAEGVRGILDGLADTIVNNVLHLVTPQQQMQALNYVGQRILFGFLNLAGMHAQITGGSIANGVDPSNTMTLDQAVKATAPKDNDE